MREQVETRIENLRAEYRAGQEMLVHLEQRRADLQVTLARISGAIQVLQELLHGCHADAERTSTAESAAPGVAHSLVVENGSC